MTGTVASRRNALLALALMAFTLGVYLPATGLDFVLYDDDFYVTGVEAVRAGLSAEGVAWAFTSTQGANWFPLTRLSWLLDVQLFGLDPRGFHATSVLLHALTTVLLFLALERLTGARGRSALVAAIFAAHPLHVEPVAWVASRKDVLSGLFAVLALLAHERAARRGGVLRHGLVFLALAAGLMAKPMLVTWPFVLLLLDAWPLRRLGRAAVLEKLPLFALVAAVSLVTLATQAEGGALRSVADVRLLPRIANAFASVAHYGADVFWPAGLAVFYPHPGAQGSWLPVAVGFLLVCGGSALALWQWRRRPWLAVGWLWTLGMLVPVIGLVQVGQAARADRYLYLPLIGISLAGVWLVADWLPRRRGVQRGAAVLGVAVVLALALVSRAQLAHWKDDESLFLHALRVTERNHVAHINLGLHYWRAERLDDAATHLLAGLRLSPRSSVGAGLLAGVRVDQGRGEEAIGLYRRALAIDPTSLRWRPPLAAALASRGREQEARLVLAEQERLRGGS